MKSVLELLFIIISFDIFRKALMHIIISFKFSVTPSCSSSIRGNYGGSKGRFLLYSGSINALEEMLSVNTCGVVACGSMCLKRGECLYIQYDKLTPGCTRCYLFKVGTGNAISTNGLFYQLSFFV